MDPTTSFVSYSFSLASPFPSCILHSCQYVEPGSQIKPPHGWKTTSDTSHKPQKSRCHSPLEPVVDWWCNTCGSLSSSWEEDTPHHQDLRGSINVNHKIATVQSQTRPYTNPHAQNSTSFHTNHKQCCSWNVLTATYICEKRWAGLWQN